MTIAFSSKVAVNGAATNTATSGTYNTTLANTLILVAALGYNAGTGVGSDTFTSITSQNLGALTFRKGWSDPAGGFGMRAELWWLLAASTTTNDKITINFSAIVNQISAMVFIATGMNTSSPFDPNVSVPAESATSSGGTPSVTVSTNTAGALFGFSATSNANATPTGFTNIAANTGGASLDYSVFKDILSSPASGQVVNGAAGGTVQMLWIDALQPPGGGGSESLSGANTIPAFTATDSLIAGRFLSQAELMPAFLATASLKAGRLITAADGLGQFASLGTLVDPNQQANVNDWLVHARRIGRR